MMAARYRCRLLRDFGEVVSQARYSRRGQVVRPKLDPNTYTLFCRNNKARGKSEHVHPSTIARRAGLTLVDGKRNRRMDALTASGAWNIGSENSWSSRWRVAGTLSLPKTPSAGLAAVTESEHDRG